MGAFAKCGAELVSLRRMPTERQQIEAAIDGLESQRKLLGDEFVDAAVATLRAKLENLSAQGSAGPSGQSLKQLTILFLDVVGSTALSERLDPEDIDAVMNGALARFGAVIEAHQGRVLRLMGDGMLAVFGADGVREDDAERAVHAGLALLEAGRASRRRHGRAIRAPRIRREGRRPYRHSR